MLFDVGCCCVLLLLLVLMLFDVGAAVVCFCSWPVLMVVGIRSCRCLPLPVACYGCCCPGWWL